MAVGGDGLLHLVLQKITPAQVPLALIPAGTGLRDYENLIVGSKEEYELLFSKHLHIKKMELCYNSIPPRKGSELFFSADVNV